MAKGKAQTPAPVKFQWRPSAGTFRVWRTDWFDDQFEVLTPAEFQDLKTLARRFGFSFKEASDDD